MLPGFRFLFAAIVLSMSILVFGLGAAALLRAAHEQFASNPSWRATPDAMLAQQAETRRPPEYLAAMSRTVRVRSAKSRSPSVNWPRGSPRRESNPAGGRIDRAI